MNGGPLGFFSFLPPPLLVLDLKGWLDDCLICETPPLRNKLTKILEWLIPSARLKGGEAET